MSCTPIPANQMVCTPCEPKSIARRWYLADRISSNNATAGSEVKPQLRGVPHIDATRRNAHVMGFRLKGTLRFATTTTTNSALSYYNVLGCLQGFFLEEPGWKFLAGDGDGRDLIDDKWLRSLSDDHYGDSDGNGVSANVGSATNVDVAFDLHYRMTQPYAPGHAALLGSIPLAAIKAGGDSAFRFTVVSSIPTAPTNLTITGFTGNLEVWLDLAYLDGVFVDHAWQLKTYTTTELGGTANDDDRKTEYLVVRSRPEDNGADYLDDFGDATHTINGDTIISGWTLAQQQAFTRFTLDTDPRWVDQPFAFESGGNTRMLFVVPPMPRSRDLQASGPITYLWASRTRTNTRFLHRTSACDSDHVKRIGKIGGRRPVVAIDGNGKMMDPKASNGSKPVLVLTGTGK